MDLVYFEDIKLYICYKKHDPLVLSIKADEWIKFNDPKYNPSNSSPNLIKPCLS